MVCAFRRRSSSRGNEARLDGLAEPGVIGDEEVDPRQPEGLAQRLHLVGVEPDAGTKGRLEEIRIGCGDAVPAQGVQERREAAWRVEPLGREVCPAFVFENPPVELVVPEDAERPPLSVVVGTGEPDDRRLTRRRWLHHLLDQPPTRTHLHEVARLRGAVRKFP